MKFSMAILLTKTFLILILRSHSVSPYSLFDQFELFDGVEEEMADLKIAHCVMKQQTGDDISNRITSSLF